MPKVLTIDGLRVVIYPNDHRPSHVHIIGRGCQAVFQLHCPEGPPSLRENYRLKATELTEISQRLAGALMQLCDQWRKIHGDF